MEEGNEHDALIDWQGGNGPLIYRRSRSDSGIFHDDSDYSQHSLSLHGLSEITEGKVEVSQLNVLVLKHVNIFTWTQNIHIEMRDMYVLVNPTCSG